ncbi:MAG: hypothetical protein KDD36_08975 [Flavobacteriales bacterium]|nr:hypothetical protein [Flavobacteriales bacterium]
MKRRMFTFQRWSLCLLIAGLLQVANAQDSSEVSVKPPPITYTTEKVFLSFRDSVQFPDTLVKNVHRYEQQMTRSPFMAHMGNTGSPLHPLLFKPNESIAFRLRDQPLQSYMFSLDSLNRYHVRKPFTDLFYVQGAKQEQVFTLLHTQNITPYLNASIVFRRISAPGFYNRQKAGHSALAFSAWYHAPSGKYTAFLSAVLNKMTYEENGGLANDSLFERNVVANRAAFPVKILEAKSAHRYKGLRLKQVIHFRGQPDSLVADEPPCCRSDFFHVISLDKTSYVYDDAQPLGGYYTRILSDSLATLDSMWMEHMHNQIGWTMGTNTGLEFAIRHEHIRTGGSVADSTFEELALDGRAWWRTTGRSVELTIAYGLAGPNEGTSAIGVVYRQRLNPKWNLTARIAQSQTRPTWMMQQFTGNHHAWNNSAWKGTDQLQKITGGDLELKHAKKWTIRFNADQVSGYFFYNSQAMPEYREEDFRVFRTMAAKELKWKKWGLDLQGIYQYTTSVYLLNLPEWLYTSSLYYERDMFSNALLARIGLDVTGFSSFSGHAWMPDVNQYYVQNENSIGDYPYVDVFVNLKIKRVRLFLKMQHLNAGMQGYRYYLTPHYPMPDRAFKLGLNWRFYD